MPIKRHETLKPLSREHHYGLLLSWKIRSGLKKNVAIERIKTYVDWFWLSHLKQHFEIEEKALFPILGKDHQHIKKAISEHDRLRWLFEQHTDVAKNLTLIADELESHIRYEERDLFNEIQNVATSEQLAALEATHDAAKFEDNLSDIFWE